ncbi:hypothetical protein [Azospirillum picis]|uniref:Uncharacterized protein n=1 Tax=Azospirillum picis TaxID=488438 RepID=A0ABU0MUL3_9PROT|nr:hypothetical protein [Azospirillum picis]MBP2303310.1 hypothetical protein [Azospirillum picis]MDQ0537150.1 hypothetical protein [Azospirillum picis]
MRRFRPIDLRTSGAVAGAILHIRPDVEPRALLLLCARLALYHRDVPRARRRLLDAAIDATAEDLRRAEQLLYTFLLRGCDVTLPGWAAAAFSAFLARSPFGPALPPPHPWLAEERARRARVAANRSTHGRKRA